MCRYEIIELEEGRKVVYSAQSPVHTALHQLYFMSDPTVRALEGLKRGPRLVLLPIRCEGWHPYSLSDCVRGP